MIGSLETCILEPVLVRGVAGKNGGDIEDNGSFLVGQGVLGYRFVGERIEPRSCQTRVRKVLPPEEQGIFDGGLGPTR